MKRLSLITGIVIIVGAIATTVVAARGCRKTATPPPAPETLSAAERTQARIRERMADPAYTNGLAILADRQAELARLSQEAAGEFAAWSTNFFASNAAARELSQNLEKLAGEGMSRTNAVFAAKVAELEAMIAADPQGRQLLDKRDMIAEALAEHGRISRAFIGGRLLRQAREHAGEERAAAERYREKLVAEGKLKPPAPRPAPTNLPSPRKEGWWTNQPPAAAQFSVPSSKFSVPGSGGPGSVPAATPETKNQEPGTRNQEPGTRNPKPETRNPKPGTENPELRTRNQEQGTK